MTNLHQSLTNDAPASHFVWCQLHKHGAVSACHGLQFSPSWKCSSVVASAFHSALHDGWSFRNMPLGTRLTAIPVLGNIFSIDSRAEKLTDAFQSLVVQYSRSRSSQSRIFKEDGNWSFDIDT